MESTTLHGKDFAWIGILYSLLAAAAQYNDTSIKERGLMSRVFVCLSFQSLRMTNFFQRPSIQSVQKILLIGNVLQNDRKSRCCMDAHGYDNQVCGDYGSSWRISRIRCRGDSRRTKALVYLVWQDTILPISHDRSTSTTHSYAEIADLHTPEMLGFSRSVPNIVDSMPSNTSYEDSIRRLCPITHAILNMRSSLPVSTSQSCTIESL